jgi:hypothetical protein
MVLHLVGAITGSALNLPAATAGSLSLAAYRPARENRNLPDEPVAAARDGTAICPGVVPCLSTRNLFDCAGTRSRVAFPRNRRKESGGTGDSMQLTAWRATIEKTPAGNDRRRGVACDRIQERRKAKARFRLPGRPPGRTPSSDALPAT